MVDGYYDQSASSAAAIDAAALVVGYTTNAARVINSDRVKK